MNSFPGPRESLIISLTLLSISKISFGSVSQCYGWCLNNFNETSLEDWAWTKEMEKKTHRFSESKWMKNEGFSSSLADSSNEICLLYWNRKYLEWWVICKVKNQEE